MAALHIRRTGGSLACYALQDGLGHVHVLILSMVLDTECFRSWAPVDAMAVEKIPLLDSLLTALIGDGQKGENKSHHAFYTITLLRACMCASLAHP